MKKSKISKYLLILAFLTFLPFASTFAAPPDPTRTVLENCREINFTSVGDFLKWGNCTIITGVIPLLFTLATAAFIYGIIQFFLTADNEEKKKKGKSFMIWGLITLFVMISMWGIVNVFSNTFKIKTFIPQLSNTPQ